MAGRRKVFGSKTPFINAYVNFSRASAASGKKDAKAAESARKKREREAESARKKSARERESARKKREREAESARKKSAREAESARKKREREVESARKKSVKGAESAKKKQLRESLNAGKKIEKDKDNARKLSDNLTKENKRQEMLFEKEQVKKDKHILKLNGLFLEYDVPMTFNKIDLKLIAYEYEIKNGLTTASQFKKVTYSYLEKNIGEALKEKLASEALGEIFKYLEKSLEKPQIEFLSSIMSQVEREYSAENKKKNPIELTSLDDLKGTSVNDWIEGPESFIEARFNFYKDKLDLLVTKKLKREREKREKEERLKAQEKRELIKLAELHQEKERLKAQEKRELEKLAELAQKKAAGELEKASRKMLITSKNLIKTLKSNASVNEREMKFLRELHNEAFFKGKYTEEIQALAKSVWKLIISSLEVLYDVETNQREFKSKTRQHYPEVDFEEIEKFYKTTYIELYRCLEKQFAIMVASLVFFDAKASMVLKERMNDKIGKNYADSKNIMKLKLILSESEHSQ
jgi:hypothetical protein